MEKKKTYANILYVSSTYSKRHTTLNTVIQKIELKVKSVHALLLFAGLKDKERAERSES